MNKGFVFALRANTTNNLPKNQPIYESLNGQNLDFSLPDLKKKEGIDARNPNSLTQNVKVLNTDTMVRSKRNFEKQKSSWPLDIGQKTNRQDIVSITYEEIGFFPRSFSRVFDRFLKQVFSDVENLVIQEYRFYRYLFLTTLKCVLILFFVPFIVNYLSKTYLVSPLTEYFWNTQQTEIFLNSYQQKRAFTELKDFEEKLYFESLINCGSPPLGGPMSKINLFEESLINEQSAWDNKTVPLGQIYSKFSPNSLPPLGGREIGANQTTSNIMSITEQHRQEIENIPVNGIASNPTFLNISNKNLSIPTEINTNKLVPDKANVMSMSERYQSQSPTKYLLETSDRMVDTLEIVQKSNRQEVFEQRLQEKTIELAIRYNNQSIEAITNFFADLISFITLCYLLIILEIQINITKSFLLEVFFGLDDGKKSLLILLITDLLVGYHSSNLWELFFEFLFNHYGLPESQTGIFLLVATLPVLLDVLFKYLIFRHLNRSSPATVATYHAIIE